MLAEYLDLATFTALLLVEVGPTVTVAVLLAVARHFWYGGS